MSTKRYSVQSATIRGAESVPVMVEVIVSPGMPGLSIVGMPDAAIQEARERVRAALRSCGFSIPGEKIVFNLAPGSLKKTGSGFDLPMALALLAATEQIPTKVLEGKLVVGELSLDGTVKPVNGLVAFQMSAFELGLDMLCAETYDAFSSSATQHKIYTCTSLRSFVEGHFGEALPYKSEEDNAGLDYSDIGGHKYAKRALQIAAAGNHGLMMMGPPGSGKTMLARRLPTILPSLSAHEIAQSSQIASIVGEPIEGLLQGRRPFRSPHHSSTLPGLIGGGNPVRPGEVSLAHNGVLFLDELAEFPHSVLQGLRQPIEEGKVSITRADGNLVMPAKFMLIAASNPCPCGYFGDAQVSCTCPLPKVHAYQNRIGGPLIDRFDMCIDVWRSDFSDVVTGDDEMCSHHLREGVLKSRAFAFDRFRADSLKTHSCSSVASLMESCHMKSQTKKTFEKLARAQVLSGRGIMRVLRVARTIADLEQSMEVREEHIAEAMHLRVRSTADKAIA